MSIEDSYINKPVDKELLPEKEKIAVPQEPQQRIKNAEKAESEKAAKEQVRLARVAELRKELGAPGTDQETQPVTEENTAKAERILKEDVKNLRRVFGMLLEDVEELLRTMNRNKFPRVKFTTEKLGNIGLGENIDKREIAQALEDLAFSIGRIGLPPYSGDLQKNNFRAVIAQLEKVIEMLSKVSGVLENVKSEDLAQREAKLTTKARGAIGRKIEDIEEGLGSFLRISR